MATVVVTLGARLFRDEAALSAEALDALDEVRLQLRCGACAFEFEVPETDEGRTSFHCPACGKRGAIAAAKRTVFVTVTRAPTREARARCPRCETVFGITITEGAPILATCTSCSARLRARTTGSP